MELLPLAEPRMKKFGTRGLSVALVLTAFGISTAQAQTNSVFIESKTVLPGQPGVTVGVYISNAVALTAIVLPFEFRTAGSNAGPHTFTIGAVTRGWNPIGRAYSSVFGPNSPTGIPGYEVNRWYTQTEGAVCTGPVAGTYQTPSTEFDGASPDGCFFTAFGQSCDNCGDDIDLDPGTETPGVDEPSFLFQFDINSVIGQFEIDTCCVRPANHLYFIDRQTSIVPGVEFTKGVITIDCDCACLGDPNCDSQTDVIDLVETINVAFRGMVAVTDSDCMLSCTDLNASGATDIVDVTLMVRAVFRGEPIETIVSNPCN